MRESAQEGKERRLRRARIWTWLSLHEIGLATVADGRSRPWTVGQIAGVFKVSPRTVQLGLADARRIRRGVRDATVQ